MNSDILCKPKFSKVNINFPLVSTGVLVLGYLADTKIQECSSPLYKIAKYICSSVSTDAEPAYMEGQLYWEIPTLKYTVEETLRVPLIRIESFEM